MVCLFVYSDQYFVILEYMERGPLNELLKNSHLDYDYACSTELDSQTTFSKTQLMMFASQVANGMDFIATHKVHSNATSTSF